MKRQALPKVMWWLGYGGLIPFAVMLLVLLTGKAVPFLEGFPQGLVLAAYTAVVLTFIGGMHWWVALGIQDGLQGTELGKLLALSLIPTMVAWFSLLLPLNITLFVLAALILLAYYADSVLLFDKIDEWYAGMRRNLSVVVALLLVVAGIAAG